MGGQTTDFLAPYGPERPVLLDAVTAPPIDWSPAPPVRRVERRPAVSVTRLPTGVWIADFGQNASGWITLTDLGPAGTRTGARLRRAPRPGGRSHDVPPGRGAPGEPPVRFVQRDEVVSAGAPGEVFEPWHIVHGFRYARLDRGDVPLDPAGVVMQVVHTDLRPTGTFACSDDDLNRLHEVARWSFRSNAVDVPTDCPQRDERLGWTGDLNAFAPTAAYLYDVSGVQRAWLHDLAREQRDLGFVPYVVPDVQHTYKAPTALWSDVAVSLPWTLYWEYGDTEILRRCYESMAAFTRSVEALLDDRGLWSLGFQFGDWLDPAAPIGSSEPGPDRSASRGHGVLRQGGPGNGGHRVRTGASGR